MRLHSPSFVTEPASFTPRRDPAHKKSLGRNTTYSLDGLLLCCGRRPAARRFLRRLTRIPDRREEESEARIRMPAIHVLSTQESRHSLSADCSLTAAELFQFFRHRRIYGFRAADFPSLLEIPPHQMAVPRRNRRFPLRWCFIPRKKTPAGSSAARSPGALPRAR